MPKAADNIKGRSRKRSKAALLLIDIINDLEFEGGDKLAANILPLTKNIARLKQRLKAAGVPAIYVNDNFGKWQSDFRKLLRHCLEDEVRGTPLVESLQPEPDDYFVLKPKHSGFYSTSLDMLLAYLGSSTLILVGVSTDLCILFTAADAFIREYRLMVPADCVASEDSKLNKVALDLIKKRLDADTRPSNKLSLKTLQAKGRASRRSSE